MTPAARPQAIQIFLALGDPRRIRIESGPGTRCPGRSPLRD